jgi:hypothetical protein
VVGRGAWDRAARESDRQGRAHGRTFSRSDFAFDPENNLYVCPGGKELRKYHRAFAKPRDGVTKEDTIIYFARKQDCDAYALKPKCCPNVPELKIARSIHEPLVTGTARSQEPRPDVSCRERKKVEMLFAHRLRGQMESRTSSYWPPPPKNLRKLAKLIPLPAAIFAT